MQPLEVLKWPEHIAHVMGHLEPDMDQEFHEFRTDSGHVMTRPKTSPFRVYKGTVSLSEADYRALNAFAGICLRGRHHFSFGHPHTGKKTYGVFNPAPVLRRSRTSSSFGAVRYTMKPTSSYELEIVIRDTTELVEKAYSTALCAERERDPVRRGFQYLSDTAWLASPWRPLETLLKGERS